MADGSLWEGLQQPMIPAQKGLWDGLYNPIMGMSAAQYSQYVAPYNPPLSSIDQLSRGNPDIPGVAGSYSMPFAGGNLGVSGSYIPQPGGAAFDSRLTYRRQF